MDLKKLNFFECDYIPLKLRAATAQILVWRSGYTGEDGFELMVRTKPADLPKAVWQTLLAEGAQPAGLAARDSLRIEKGFLLSGQDFHPVENPRSPIETNWNCAWAVEWDHEFIGKAAAEALQAEGVKELFAGIELESRRVPRRGIRVKKAGKPIGVLTSGAVIPNVEGGARGFALGYLACEYAKPGTEVVVAHPAGDIKGVVAKLPH
jgi:aminomethyltransferase